MIYPGCSPGIFPVLISDGILFMADYITNRPLYLCLSCLYFWEHSSKSFWFISMKSFSALYMRPWIVLKEYKCVNLCVNYPLTPSSTVFCFDLRLAFAQLCISYFKNHERKKNASYVSYTQIRQVSIWGKLSRVTCIYISSAIRVLIQVQRILQQVQQTCS